MAKSKRPNTKKKLDALKEGRELPVDPVNLSYVQEPGTDERAVLDLARAIHRAESTGCAVSWSAQERAAAYFNEHGLIGTLDEMFRLEERALPGATA
jgi:hypothetical protein